MPKSFGQRRTVFWTAFLVFGGYLSWYCEGKRMCYVCNTKRDGPDCLFTPENVTIPDNPTACRDFCTIKRKEFINIPEALILVELERSCERKPFMLDGVDAESLYRIYYRSCKAHLCNFGDGITSLKDIPEEPEEEEEEETNNSSYRSTSIRIFKIYFFAFVAFISSIT